MDNDSSHQGNYVLLKYKYNFLISKEVVHDLHETLNYILHANDSYGYILADSDLMSIYGYRNVHNSILGSLLKKDFEQESNMK